MNRITILAVLLFCTAAAYGQDTKGREGLDRQVSVTKDYAPNVDKASKLDVKPQVDDTVRLRPDFDYVVRPKAWRQGFGVTPIRPATVDATAYRPRYPLYIKAGGGYPGQTLFDLYANSTNPGRNGIGFYINHTAQLAKIEFDDLIDGGKIEKDAKSTLNSTGLFGTVGVGRFALKGEIGWDYDVFTLYADKVILAGAYAIPPMQHHSIPRASLVFGDDFTDLSHLNFRIGGDGYHLTDRRGNKETGVDAFAQVGKRFAVHNISLKAAFEMHKGGGEIKNVESTIVTVGPEYEFRADRFLFRMGATLAFDKVWSRGGMSEPDRVIFSEKTYILPQAELQVALSKGFVPYIKFRSDITANSALQTGSLNPYLLVNGGEFGPAFPSMVEYDLRAGISGGAGRIFSYNIFAGIGVVKNDIQFRRAHLIIVFGPYDDVFEYTSPDPFIEEKRDMVTAGIETETRIDSNFTLAISGQYFNNRVDGKKIGYLPEYTATVGMTYNRLDKILLRAGADIRGGYKFLHDNRFRLVDSDFEAPTAVDLYLDAQYNVSPTFGIFVEGRNLANSKLYPYPFYQGVGINVSAGVKVRF